MQVRIKRIDKTLPLPIYKTAGAVAVDLTAREETTVAPGALVRIPCNIIVDTPAGYMLLLAPRSSMPTKKPGLILPHSVGIVDQDYCGPDDELMFQVQNVGTQPVVIARGEAIGQAVFVRVDRAELVEVDETVGVSSRGGFGSTD